MKPYRCSGSATPFILNHGSKKGLAVSLAFRLLYPGKKKLSIELNRTPRKMGCLVPRAGVDALEKTYIYCPSTDDQR